MSVTLLALAVVAAAAGAGADPPAEDAPYVPSPREIVERMLELGEVGPEDYLIDLGSGDGRIVLTAARTRGARGLGIEIRGDLVARARRAAEEQGVDDRVRFVQQDLFEADLSRATVVTVYLLPETLGRLRGKLLGELAPGTRVVSHDYPMEGWKPERFVQIEHPAKVRVTGVARTNIYLYRIPADVSGRWSVSLPPDVVGQPLALELEQGVNVVQGMARIGDAELALEQVELSGRRLSFTLPALQAHFTGRLQNGKLTGMVEAGGGRRPWRATRG